MLNKPVDEIVMEGSHVIGVKSEGEVNATAKYCFPCAVLSLPFTDMNVFIELI